MSVALFFVPQTTILINGLYSWFFHYRQVLFISLGRIDSCGPILSTIAEKDDFHEVWLNVSETGLSVFDII